MKVGIATGPPADWTTTLRGPSTGGARVAAAAVPHAGTAGVFATFEGGGGHVYLVRQLGTHAPSATQRVSGSKKASIRSVAVAMNASGDVLAAWDLHGEIQARLWYGSSKRFGPIQNLAKVTGALHLGRRARQSTGARPSRGSTSSSARATPARRRPCGRPRAARRAASCCRPSSSRRSRTPRSPAAPSSRPRTRRPDAAIVAWSGRNAVRAAFVNGRSIGAPQDLAPIPPPDDLATSASSNLVVGANGAAAVTMVSPVDATNNQVLVAPLADGAAAFGPAEAVSAPGQFLANPSAGVRPGHQPARRGVARPPARRHQRVQVATRPSP